MELRLSCTNPSNCPLILIDDKSVLGVTSANKPFISSTNDDQDLWLYMVSQGHNELTHCGLVMPYSIRNLGHHWLLSGPCLNIKTVFPGMGIPMLKIRRLRDRLIFNMGIPILVRWHLYIETPPDNGLVPNKQQVCFEPMMVYFTDTHMHHWAWMS